MAEYIEKQEAATIPVLPKEYRKYQTMNLDDAYENGWYDALECVEKLPQADVKPVVRGRWETDSDSVPHCTNCDSLASQKLVLDTKTLSCTARFAQSNFCPNCGADMRGGDAE